MKYILIAISGFILSGCTTPFNEYYQPTTVSIQEKSIEPARTVVEAPKQEKKEEDTEVKTYAVELR